MKTMHLKKHKKKRIGINIIVIIIILLFLCVYYVIKYFNKKAIPIFIEYSNIEVKKLISLIVTSTVNDEVSKYIDYESLFIINMDSNENIKTIDLNSSVVNNLLYKTSKLVKQNLLYLEKGEINKITKYDEIFINYDNEKLYKGIIYELPIGLVFNNLLLSNILPKIPLKISALGNVYSVLNTDIKPYGINMSLLQINIDVTTEVKILLPFITDKIEVVTSIPLVVKIIQGNMPNYYLGGYLNSITN